MINDKKILFSSLFIVSLLALIHCTKNKINPEIAIISSSYSDLESFFAEWRSFELPPLIQNVPDYTSSTFDNRYPAFQQLFTKLQRFDTSGWAISQKVDYEVIQAEMNGYDFNYRILKPWQRDPAFYTSIYLHRSDVPAHEGPTHHKTTEVWTYSFPLDSASRLKFIANLKVITPLNKQAISNLTGNARDLWLAGIRDIKSQSTDLKSILEKPGIKNDDLIVSFIMDAIQSTDDLAKWLETESPKKTGPSGLGKENYTWYQQNVHLIPMTWEDEVLLLKRELARAWSALKLEEHHNLMVKPLVEINNEEEYNKLTLAAAEKLMLFLEEKKLMTVKNYFRPALKAQIGKFTPKEKRNFFNITTHYDPRPLYSHFYHWFELAVMDQEPLNNKIRKGPLLYNIFDTHSEGIATAVEEIFMHAGLYDDSPRSKEIVYIMLAQRAARGLGSLYAHANEMTMSEAGGIHAGYTPRGWMKTEKELQIFEQHLYLRQPGYGTSYVTGKYLIDQLMADYSKNKEANNEEFKIADFLDAFNNTGNIPVSLSHWELTGNKIFVR